MNMSEQTKTTRNKLEQGRAKFAYNCAKGNVTDDYRQCAKKLPMYIKTNGLGAAMAFMKTKHSGLYNDVANWLKEQDCTVNVLVWGTNSSSSDLIERIVDINSTDYRAVTVEVLAFLNWLRRFADGFKKT
jgi:CRISPR-associated protein Cmr5